MNQLEKNPMWHRCRSVSRAPHVLNFEHSAHCSQMWKIFQNSISASRLSWNDYAKHIQRDCDRALFALNCTRSKKEVSMKQGVRLWWLLHLSRCDCIIRLRACFKWKENSVNHIVDCPFRPPYVATVKLPNCKSCIWKSFYHGHHLFYNLKGTCLKMRLP